MRTRALIPVLVAIILLPSAAHSVPVFGFTESFPGPGVGGWAGGITTFSNPGSGGALGGSDGYLFGNRISVGNWGLRCRSCLEYTGDWSAAGITHIGVSLNDIGAPNAFEVHVAIGNDTNRWQYDIGFDPPNGQWGRFVVDLTDAGNFTQIIGSGTLAAALQNVTVLQFRHDLAPFMQQPDATSGDLGIDEITLGDLAVPVRELTWGRLKSLYGQGR